MLSISSLAQDDEGPIGYTYATYFTCSGDLSVVDDLMAEDADRLNGFVDDGTITKLFTITGRWDLNRGWIDAPLRDWDERDITEGEIAAGQDLFQTGVLDSMATLDYIGQLEDDFGISIPNEELIPQNLWSIEATVGLVSRHL